MRPISNMSTVTALAANYSQRMSDLTLQAVHDPTIVQDPGRVAQFSQQLMDAQQAFQLASRSIQDLHKEDQILSELLRDA